MRRVKWLSVVIVVAAAWWWFSSDIPLPEPVSTRGVVMPAPSARAATQPTHQGGAVRHQAFGADHGWGSASGQVGRLRPAEANPEGPMAITTQGKQTWVLDQVNRRLVRYDQDGTSQSLPLTVREPQDLVVTEQRVYVLDRLGDRAIAVLDLVGPELARVPLPSDAPSGITTAMMVRDGRLWIERSHESLLAIADSDGGTLLHPQTLPGRLSHDGMHLLRVRVTDARAGRVGLSWLSSEPLQLEFAREVAVDGEILYVLEADSDRQNLIYLALLVATGPDTNQAQVFCFDGAGALVSEQILPSQPVAEEMFRRFAVDPAGGFVYAYADDAGYHVRRGTCR